MCQQDMRVKVWNGDRSKYLGEGTLVGFVPVYIITNPDQSIISSSHIAEEKPDGIPEELIERLPSNPKIQLDSGGVVYGCQVWWKRVEE